MTFQFLSAIYFVYYTSNKPPQYISFEKSDHKNGNSEAHIITHMHTKKPNKKTNWQSSVMFEIMSVVELCESLSTSFTSVCPQKT